MSHVNLDNLIQNLDLDLETYGVEEFRDGFFDAEFFKPPKEDMSKLMKMAEYSKLCFITTLMTFL
jgi:hypothetical protein